jgi:hypothetical protein
LLQLSAYYGHLHVVKYLCEVYGLGREDVRALNNSAARFAAVNGHVEVVQYLTQLSSQGAVSVNK